MNIFTHSVGTTKIEPEKTEDLIPKHITTKDQLNEWEQDNILSAENFYAQKHFHYNDILHTSFANELHKKMFDKTWKWAVKFRKTEKNIGIDPRNVSVELKKLLDDVRFQINHKSYSIREISTRFHHRLVFIHPYPNGNSRHARFMTDLLLLSQHECRFNWGEHFKPNLTNSEIKQKYIQALTAADKGDYHFLLAFVGCEMGGGGGN